MMGAQQSSKSLPNILLILVILGLTAFLLLDRAFVGEELKLFNVGTLPESFPNLAGSGRMVYVGEFVEAWKGGNLTAAELHDRLGLKDLAIIPALYTRLSETWKGLELVEGQPYFHIRAPIPVIGANTVNNAPMLRRLVYSIDVPVQKIVIVVNSLPGEAGEQAEQEMLAETRELQAVLGKFLEVVISHCNRGCAGGWNSIIYAAKDSPWWLISNDDAAFKPGALRSVADHVYSQPDKVMFSYAGFQVFVLTRFGLQEVGTFDENIWPAYHEDCDYGLRIALSGHRIVGFPDDFSNIHGDPDADPVATAQVRSPDRQLRNGLTHNNNGHYYSMKWNVSGHCGAIEEGMFKTPFNDPKGNLGSWTLDRGLRARSMSCWDQNNDVDTRAFEEHYLGFVGIGKGGTIGTAVEINKALISLWPKDSKSRNPRSMKVDDADICASPFAVLT